jgi:hypothetical protein
LASELKQAAAESQRAAAESERAAAESKAVLTFLVEDMLGAAAPYQKLGRDVKVTNLAAKGHNATVADVLANAENRIDIAFPNQPLVEAGVRHAIGATRNGLGQYDLAERQLTRSYELRRKLLGLEDDETIDTLIQLLRAMRDPKVGEMRDPAKAKEASKLGERALEVRRRKSGPEDPRTLDLMYYLGDVLGRQGRNDESLKLHLETLEIRRRVLGPEHPDTLLSMHAVADRFYWPLGKL